MKSKITILFSLLLAIFLFSCENEAVNPVVDDTESIVMDEILSLKSGEIGDEDSQQPVFGCRLPNFRQRILTHRFDSDCLTVTSSGEDYPKEIVIDYGDGCLNINGELKTGKVIISISDDILNEGAVCKIEYEDLMIGDRAIEMTKTKTNLGQNAEGNWEIETLTDLTITYEDGSSSTRSSNAKNEWLSGFGTEEKLDDIFMRTGSGNVVTSEGAEYSREITTALLFDRSCTYIKSGVIELDKNGTAIVIDFGDGECDEWATLTIDGVEKEIDLSLRGKRMTGFLKKQ